MTGSVPSDTQQQQQSKTATGKSEEPTAEKTSQSPPASSPPAEAAPQSLLCKEDPAGESESQGKKTPPPRKKLLPSSSRSAGCLPGVRPAMEDSNMLMVGSLRRRGRAQSYLTLYSGAADPVFGVLAGDERGFDDSCGARSELSAPVSARRRGGRGRREVRAYGTLERATSYSSLASAPPRPTFRSANSARPPPAPPCTTSRLDFGRHHPVSSVPARLGRAGTPRRNNPHPVGLHFQSPFNQDGKTFEVWNPDENMVANRLPQMCNHIEGTNFTSGKMQLSFSPETSPDRAPHQPSPGSSVYRLSYRPPQGVSSFDRSLPTTRFGSTQNRAAAVGVVPNVMSPRCGERRVKLHIPRGQKLESLV